MPLMGRFGRVLGLLAMVVITVGCGASGPSSTSECQDVRLTPGEGGLSVAFGWEDREYAFDTAGPLLVCIGSAAKVLVSLTGTTGITISPPDQTTSGDAVVRFEVRVRPGTSGRVTYAQTSVASGQTIHEGLYVTITSDVNGWRFGRPE